MNAPLVTVYMPTHNRVKLLVRAVESVLAQEYKDIELIVVDDCSTDDTRDYLKGISSRDSRVHCIFNEQQSGACASRNKAIAMARGAFITGLDDDDFFQIKHVGAYLDKAASLLSHSVIGLFPFAYRVKANGQCRLNRRKSSVTQSDLIDGNLIGNQVFTSLSLMKAAGPFDEQLHAFQDLDLWYRMLGHPASRMICTGQITYVTDEGHGEGRISDRDVERVRKSLDYLCAKHQFTPSERRIMSFLICHYTREMPPLTVALQKLWRNPCAATLRQCWYTYGDAIKFKLGM